MYGYSSRLLVGQRALAYAQALDLVQLETVSAVDDKNALADFVASTVTDTNRAPVSESNTTCLHYPRKGYVTRIILIGYNYVMQRRHLLHRENPEDQC